MIYRWLNFGLLRQANKKQSKRRRNSRSGFSMEPLEQRLALSASPGTATLTNGALVVCGTDADNTIIVAESNGQIFVAADFLDAPQRFTPGEVTSITVSGGGGNDRLVATSLMVAATLEGEAGADQLFGSAFGDTLDGGEGDDFIVGAAGDDVISAGAGNDTVIGGAGSDTVNGDAGDDSLSGGAGDDTMDGGADNDLLVGADGADDLQGGTGNDSLVGDAGNDTLDGGADDDILMGAEGDDTLTGGDGNDRLVGQAGTDNLGGGAGDDLLFGMSDDDALDAGAGNDLAMGGGGSDDLVGGPGADTLIGGDGDDTMAGDADADTLYGEGGVDELAGGDGADSGFGGLGADTLMGQSGDDELIGGPGADVISGGDGADNLQGGDDRDVLIGGAGGDALLGQGHEDLLVAGSTSSDSDASALAAIGTDWSANTDYEDRIADLQDRLATASTDDSAVDRLGGDDGRDWFFPGGSDDNIVDQASDEIATGRDVVAVNDTYQTEPGQTVTATLADGLLANDSGPSGSVLTVATSPISGPSSGSLVLNADGTFTYTPNDSSVTSDSFVYTVSNAEGLSAQATVTITFEAPNRGPVAAADTYTVDEDAVLTVQAADAVLINDNDADGDSLTVSTSPTVLPVSGNLTLNADGTFTYTPNANFSGSDSFVYEVSDPSGLTDQAKVSITVNAVNDVPVASDASFSVDQGATFTTQAGVNDLLTGATDVDNDSLTAAVVDPPANGTVDLQPDGNFSYAPNSGFSGTDTFTYRVNDGTVDSAIATVTMTVNAITPNIFTVAENAAEDTLVGKVEAPVGTGSDAIYEFAPPAARPAALGLVPDDHLEGDPASPLLLVEYVDFQCPTCAAFRPIVNQLEQDFAGDLLVVSRHFALNSIHDNALEAAIAAEAAANQGAFDAMGDLLFERQTAWASSSDPAAIFESYASELGLDVPQFLADTADPAMADRVTRDTDAARNDLELTGTPSFLLNDELLNTSEIFSVQGFSDVVQDRLDNLTDAFALDRTTGELTVRDSALLDFATTPTVTLDVTVNDGSSIETIPVTVNVTEVVSGIPPLPAGAILTTTPSGLQVYDFEAGSGASPIRSNTVTVDYIGYLPDGTIFDSNNNIDFPLTGVIEGFAEGIEGMSVGGMRRIVIPPNLGYGSGGNPGAGIGGTDTITFDVTLHAIPS